MSSFSAPIEGLVGGSLIGFSASSLLLGIGGILGFSVISSSTILNPRHAITSSENRWKIVFLSTFLVTSFLLKTFHVSETDLCCSLQESEVFKGNNLSNFGYGLAGFLVGFGSKLGSGCTSGHGICGVARLSIRSITAVLTFMTTAILTSTFILPLATKSKLLVEREEGWDAAYVTTTSTVTSLVVISLLGICSLVLFFKDYQEIKKIVPDKNETAVTEEQEGDEEESGQEQVVRKKEDVSNPPGNLKIESSPRKLLIAAVSASMFSIGLEVARMVRQKTILEFLDMKGISGGYWDGTLVLVMGSGVIISAIGYHWVEGYNVFKNDKMLACPMVGYGKFNVPETKIVDAKLVLGAAIFGCGWGFGGLCPGPGFFVAFSGCPKVLFFWLPFYVIGTFIADRITKLME